MKNQFGFISAKMTVFCTAFALIVTTAIFTDSSTGSSKRDSSSRPVEAMLKARAEQSSQKTPPDVKEASRQGLEELVRSQLGECMPCAPHFPGAAG